MKIYLRIIFYIYFIFDVNFDFINFKKFYGFRTTIKKSLFVIFKIVFDLLIKVISFYFVNLLNQPDCLINPKKIDNKKLIK